jgi:hypothetical protein
VGLAAGQAGVLVALAVKEAGGRVAPIHSERLQAKADSREEQVVALAASEVPEDSAAVGRVAAGGSGVRR